MSSARRAACGGDAGVRFVQGDIRTAGFAWADAVVILDVLHYVDYEAQAGVLRRRARRARGRRRPAAARGRRGADAALPLHARRRPPW
jgi:hypothetical protein